MPETDDPNNPIAAAAAVAKAALKIEATTDAGRVNGGVLIVLAFVVFGVGGLRSDDLPWLGMMIVFVVGLIICVAMLTYIYLDRGSRDPGKRSSR